MRRKPLNKVLLACLAAITAIAAASDSTVIENGRTIYRTSTTTDGRTIAAFVQGDVPLPAGANACTNCHRRSGLGVSEGGSRSLNLSAQALFTASEKPPFRPAYDDETLLTAIVGGVSAAGRPLSATMPRYQLSAEDGEALVAYLHTLGATPPGGVDETTIAIATVVADQAPENERDAVIQVMRRFVEQKNAESRRETQRAAASNRHSYGRNRQRAHRIWELKVWTLHGEASTWTEQLASYYAEKPVFAIASGSTGTDWKVVHDFCEVTELACVLPLSTPPPHPDQDFYSLYFSTGPVLAAHVTAQHIIRTGNSQKRKVLIVYEDDEDTVLAVSELERRLTGDSNVSVTAIALPTSKVVSWRQWRSMLKSESPAVVVAWVFDDSLRSLASSKIASELLPPHIYTMHSTTDWLHSSLSAHSIVRRVRHVYPYSLPKTHSSQFPRERFWLLQNGFAELDEVAAAKVLYACRVLGMGLADIQTSFSREYFLESLEHALDGTELTSLFPRTSLGPNQRLLSRGAFVVELSPEVSPIFTNAEWVQP